MKDRIYFNYQKTMTDQDIVEHAKIIAQASKEVHEIEEARKKLKVLNNTIALHSRFIQSGKIDFLCYGEFEWHTPVMNAVTVSSPYEEFPTYVRDMTPVEIEKHAQLEFPFQEEEITPQSDEEDEPDDRELSEIFGTNEEPNPDFEWIIEPLEHNKHYPWAISKKRALGIQPEHLFRTKEEAEEFMSMFILGDNKYHTIPGSIFQLEKRSTYWAITKSEYENDIVKSCIVLHTYTCYYEAKDALQRLYDATIKEGKSIFPPKTETHALGGTDKYQIVEGPDGHLTTIQKEAV